MTQYVNTAGGTLAYEVTGTGPLIVIAHGIGNQRTAYRHRVPLLARAGYRVAATAPELVSALVEVNPCTRVVPVDFGALFTVRRYRKSAARMAGTMMFKSLRSWLRYLDLAYPVKPADYAEDMAAMAADLRELGRMDEFMKTFKSTPKEAAAQVSNVKCPALIIMGGADPDFANPRAEGEAVVAAMPAGLGRVAMVEGSGHYPHADSADQVAKLILEFLDGEVLA
jgi:pimeloyl-ACP methyl ester carboxylesterase